MFPDDGVPCLVRLVSQAGSGLVKVFGNGDGYVFFVEDAGIILVLDV